MPASRDPGAQVFRGYLPGHLLKIFVLLSAGVACLAMTRGGAEIGWIGVVASVLLVTQRAAEFAGCRLRAQHWVLLVETGSGPTLHIPLWEAQLDVQQGWLGRWLGFGDVLIEHQGRTIRLRSLGQVDRLRSIQQASWAPMHLRRAA